MALSRSLGVSFNGGNIDDTVTSATENDIDIDDDDDE